MRVPEKATWYYRVGDRQRGPVTESQLRSMAEGGVLRPGDYVWQDGMEDWVKASTIPWLFPGENATDPVGPPPFRGRGGAAARERSDGWGGGELALFIATTVLIPLVGIIMGVIDLSNGGPRRRTQGGILLGFGVFMILVYVVGFEVRGRW